MHSRFLGVTQSPSRAIHAFLASLGRQAVPDSLPPHGLLQAVLHYVPEFARIHAHRVSDVTNPSHPLPLPFYALDLSQHQGLFQ